MKRELYDFLMPPDMPKGVDLVRYYFPHQMSSSLGLQCRGPAGNDPPCMATHYNKEGNLLMVRFIFKDGTYKDDYIETKTKEKK